MITITATLLQNGSYGDPVSNQRVFFFDQTFNTLLGSDLSDANGIASIDWYIPSNHTLGPTTINATFYGNESLSLAPSCQWTVLTVMSPTNIEIGQTPTFLAPGDFLSFSVHLTDDSHIPLSNATVIVFRDSLPLALGTTNSSGDTYFKIECNSSWYILGNNNIRIVFQQDLINYLNASEFEFAVEVSKIPTFLTSQRPFPSEVILNENVDLYIRLSETNHPLPNEFLQVYLDDSPLFSTTSNSSGIAHIDLEIDERFTLGVHVLIIHYNGTERYSESVIELFLSVKSPAQISIGVPESVVIGSRVEIEVAVSDLLNRTIPDSIISILDTTSSQIFTIPSNPTETTISFQYELLGPTGIHILIIELIENPFVITTIVTSNFTAWSIPEISLIHCNIEHYASPGQDIHFGIHMTYWAGNCSFKSLQLLIDDQPHASVVTDANGQVNFTLVSPLLENHYNISLVYKGNETLFESPTKLDYAIQVTMLMPVRLELDFYELNAPLHEVSVQLTLRGLNGSTLQGVQITFDWLESRFDTETTSGGIIILHLRVPTTSGNYVLYYESESSSSVTSTSGSFIIEITTSNVMSLQGVGIAGLTITLIASVSIATIPIIRRRYLVG